MSEKTPHRKVKQFPNPDIFKIYEDGSIGDMPCSFPSTEQYLRSPSCLRKGREA